MRLRSILLFLTAVGLVAGAYVSVRTESLMADAAKNYLASLNPEQRKKTMFALDNMDERTHWLYTPFERHGLQMREMTSDQKHLAEALLSAGVSQQGLVKVHTIMSLDSILRMYEKNQGPERDPDKYFVSIFGEPSATGRWGYRVEGHHVSLNFTVVGDKIASTPSFFGSNPAEVVDGPMKGLRVLSREEDLGLELVQSLTDAQRAIAIVDKTAPADVLTTNSRKAALTGQPNGLPFGSMTAKQKAFLAELVNEYAADFPPAIAQKRVDQFQRTQPSLFFAWAGGTNKGDKNYYRVQTSEFLIEYDKTQDNGNHIHSVWRDFNDDWGSDLLAEHYQASH
jgi:Protein of unknown function (DUF3500)